MREFTAADASWLQEYCDAIHLHYNGLFSRSSTSFPESSALLQRFADARDAVISEGWKTWAGLDAAHNELCVAGAILEAPNYPVEELAYEPPPSEGAKTIDFRAEGHDGRVWFVDVKTIAPDFIDRWEQFEAAKTHEWLADRTELVLLRDWLGGELWHSKTAARGRMLEYTLELEGKLGGYPGFEAETTVLMLCGNGFHWHEDELEDFVAFYVEGHHRPDDSLAAMERHFIKAKKLNLPRRVVRFGYCQRQSCQVSPSRLNWWVKPPRLPAAMAL